MPTVPQAQPKLGGPVWRHPGWEAALWATLGVGAALRLAEFAIARPLWRDEAALALNLIGRSWLQLAAPLDHNQVAPWGFLLLERGAVVLFGGGERALRLVPLLAGLAALWLFARLARRHLAPRAAWIAVTLMAVGYDPLYYANEAKQYGPDLLAALVTAWALQRVYTAPLSRLRWAGLALLAAALPWFSHPSVFVIAGLGGSALWVARRGGDRPALRRVALFCAVAAASFAIEYALQLRPVLAERQGMQAFWADHFPPWPDSPAALWWYPNEVLTWCYGLTHTVAANLAIVALIAGLVRMGRGAERGRLGLWLAPLGVAFLVSAGRWYPYHGRLLLFGLPFVIAIVAVGADGLLGAALRWRPRVWPRAGRAAAVVGLALLLLLPTGEAVMSAFRIGDRHSLTEVLAELRAVRQPDACLWVHPKGDVLFRYHAPRYGLDEVLCGPPLSGNPGPDRARIDGHAGPAWLVFPRMGGPERERALRALLPRNAERPLGIEAPNAAAYRLP